MAVTQKTLPAINTIWDAIKIEIHQQSQDEPRLAPFFDTTVLSHKTLEQSLSFHLAQKFADKILSESFLNEVILRSLTADASITTAICEDLKAFVTRDPTCNRFSLPFLYFKGFHAIQMYRVGHWLWHHRGTELALFLQSRLSEIYAIDIHPAAQIGHGIMIDHATSIVIGETAVVGNNVSMLHEVTLGGTGKEIGDRHPKVGSGVLIGAGTKILGNVRIGAGAKIGAGSVVLNDVQAHCTVAGVPAKLVGECDCDQPSLEMDHSLNEK